MHGRKSHQDLYIPPLFFTLALLQNQLYTITITTYLLNCQLYHLIR